MPKFRKKPVVIEAEQWFPGVKVDGVDTTSLDLANKRYHEFDSCGGPCDFLNDMWAREEDGSLIHGHVETLEGRAVCRPGDWIITGIRGEKYPCKADIFAATYEPVEEPA